LQGGKLGEEEVLGGVGAGFVGSHHYIKALSLEAFIAARLVQNESLIRPWLADA
jgi:hypothetical protein